MLSPFNARARRLTILSVLAVVLLITTLVAIANAGVGRIGVDDFVEYWSAGRLNLTGSNPYAADALLALQRQVGWRESAPLMMWNPPPALTLVMPFGLLDYGAARLLWLLVNLVLVVGCVETLWRFYDGNPTHHLWGLVVSLLFFPTLLVLYIGQIGVWLLVGLVTFVVSAHHKRWAVAGAALALVTLKPHVTYLVWAALGLWWLRERKWGFVAGLLAAIVLAWLVPMLINPQVTNQYINAVRTAPPLYWMTTTWGAHLRQWFGWEREWLQFAPSIVGLCWLLWYWLQHPVWRWKEEFPQLLLISATTMSFGWAFDLVMLLPAVVQMVIWLRATANRWLQLGSLGMYAALNAFALWQHQNSFASQYFVWLPLAMLLLYQLLQVHNHATHTTRSIPS